MTSKEYKEIDEVIKYIHQHIYDPLSLSRLSRHISYSPYHFTRIFKGRMGLSPMYYVASLRLQKAKELLLSTNLPVRDIAMEIGQESLGTFTTRFTERVGVTPSQFRNSMNQANASIQSLQKLNDWPSSDLISNKSPQVKGTVRATVPFKGIILIGLFIKPIPEGLPKYGTLLSSLGDFCFTDVYPGTYYLMATSVSWEMHPKDILLTPTTLRARLMEPIILKPDTAVPHQNVLLDVPQLDDPPILISLPILMNNFLNRVLQHRNQ